MKSKHTSGPWSMEPVLDHDGYRRRDDDLGYTITTPAEGLPNVATVPGGWQAKGNATLIAAAPELLAALIQAEYRLGSLHWDMVNFHDAPCPSDCRVCGEIAGIQAAIAKAGGQSGHWEPINRFFVNGGE